MKRVLLLAAALIIVFPMSGRAQAVSTSASCAILMDADSGRILYDQNIHQQRLIASITKLMTALVAVEKCGDLQEPVTIRPEWTGVEGSSIYLKAGEKIPLEGLLYGLLLQSGNDAAVAIACHVAGDTERFAALMNEKAAELGMTNSSFSNPSGLNDDDHYSTAYDMAILACACLENEVVSAICASRAATVGTRTFFNHNKLLHRYDGCIGMKTGYTELAGRTLVSAAERDGQTLVCVTLNDGNDWNDHERLLDYGFEWYPRQELCRTGQIFGAVPVEGSLIPAVQAQAAEPVGYPLREEERLELRVELAERLESPVVCGQQIGRAVWLLNGDAVAETALVCTRSAARNTCPPQTFWERLAERF